MQRAIQTMAVPADQILYAKSHASDTGTDYGERQVWVYGDKQMRWLEADNEEVYAEGKGTTRWLRRQGREPPGRADGPQRDLPRGRAARGGEVGQGRRP